MRRWYLPRGYRQPLKTKIKRRVRRQQRGCLPQLLGALVLLLLAMWVIARTST